MPFRKLHFYRDQAIFKPPFAFIFNSRHVRKGRLVYSYRPLCGESSSSFPTSSSSTTENFERAHDDGLLW